MRFKWPELPSWLTLYTGVFALTFGVVHSNYVAIFLGTFVTASAFITDND